MAEEIPLDIEFKNVTFSYVEGREKLKDISLTIPAGTTFGILGGTGSGKSTLVALLVGMPLYEKNLRNTVPVYSA